MKPFFNPDQKLRVGFAEPGATSTSIECLKQVTELLRGLSTTLAISTLTNASAIVLAEVCENETRTFEQARRVGKEIIRCLAVNFEMARKRAKEQ